MPTTLKLAEAIKGILSLCKKQGHHIPGQQAKLAALVGFGVYDWQLSKDQHSLLDRVANRYA